MTETLKPFITPTSAENYVTKHSSAAATRHHRSCYFLAITASVVAIILTAAVLGVTIWNTMRISNLQTEVQTLNKVIESMQKRLGLTYLDDLNELQKGEEENNNQFDELPDDDDDDDIDSEIISGDDEDDDEDDYADYDLINKFRHYQETEDDDDETDNSDSMGDNNVYDDFGKFNESKKKKLGERKPRSVAALNDENDDIDDLPQNERPILLRSFKEKHHKSIVTGDYERRRSPMRPYSSRRRKYPTVKSGDSLISAKYVATERTTLIDYKPAAHFHITQKLPFHKAPKIVPSYNGDMYIGKQSWTNEVDVNAYFLMENGVLTVIEPGLYYVYAQICYHNHFPKNGFIIFHNDKPFLQCLNYINSNNVSVLNTCHTSGLIYLQHNEQLHIRDFSENRRTILIETNYRSYFGLIKV